MQDDDLGSVGPLASPSVPSPSLANEPATPSLAAADAAELAAAKVLRSLENAIREEKSSAAKAIDARFADDLANARTTFSRAAEAHRNAKDALLPNHPWEGRRVWRLVNGGRPWERNMVREEGIVETVRQTADFPANTSRYSRPELGEPIVRCLKKDGSPGLRFERMHRNHLWKLAEEGAATTPTADGEASKPKARATEPKPSTPSNHTEESKP